MTESIDRVTIDVDEKAGHPYSVEFEGDLLKNGGSMTRAEKFGDVECDKPLAVVTASLDSPPVEGHFSSPEWLVDLRDIVFDARKPVMVPGLLFVWFVRSIAEFAMVGREATQDGSPFRESALENLKERVREVWQGPSYLNGSRIDHPPELHTVEAPCGDDDVEPEDSGPIFGDFSGPRFFASTGVRIDQDHGEMGPLVDYGDPSETEHPRAKFLAERTLGIRYKPVEPVSDDEMLLARCYLRLHKNNGQLGDAWTRAGKLVAKAEAEVKRLRETLAEVEVMAGHLCCGDRTNGDRDAWALVDHVNAALLTTATEDMVDGD